MKSFIRNTVLCFMSKNNGVKITDLCFSDTNDRVKKRGEKKERCGRQYIAIKGKC